MQEINITICHTEAEKLYQTILNSVKKEYPKLSLPLEGSLEIAIRIEGRILGTFENYAQMVSDACINAGIIKNARQFTYGSVKLIETGVTEKGVITRQINIMIWRSAEKCQH